MTSFDYSSLFPAGQPAPAVKFAGFPKYNFFGGHNDAEPFRSKHWSRRPTQVLRREGAARHLRPEQRPAGLSALARVPGHASSRSHAGIDCTADEILITSRLETGPRPGQHACWWRRATPS